MKVFWIVLGCIAGIFLVLVLISIVIAALSGKRLPKEDLFAAPRPRQDEYAEKLSRAVRFRTLGVAKANGSEETFESFWACLRSMFPNFFAKAEKIDLPDAELYLIRGSANDGKPSLIMAHSDVVDAEGEWIYPPFDGVIADGKIWGRGTMDDKGMLIALLISLENLLSKGFAPRNDLYLCSSHDEESNGEGSLAAAEYFRSNGIILDSVLDEGGSITEKVMPGIGNDIAVIGLCEKGHLDMKFTARGKGGHSSTPTKDNPFAHLAAFMHYCDTHTIFRNKFSVTFLKTLRTVAPYMPFPMRILLCNIWLYKPLLKLVLPLTGKTTACMMHSNIVFTMAKGSEAANVLPSEAYVVANLRNLNDEPQEEVIRKISKIAAKFHLESEVLFHKKESTVTPPECREFEYVCSLVAKHFPGVIASPYVMMGGTDSTRMSDICDQIIRFVPIRLSKSQLDSMHAPNENVGITEFAKGVEFLEDYISGK